MCKTSFRWVPPSPSGRIILRTPPCPRDHTLPQIIALPAIVLRQPFTALSLRSGLRLRGQALRNDKPIGLPLRLRGMAFPKSGRFTAKHATPAPPRSGREPVGATLAPAQTAGAVQVDGLHCDVRTPALAGGAREKRKACTEPVEVSAKQDKILGEPCQAWRLGGRVRGTPGKSILTLREP